MDLKNYAELVRQMLHARSEFQKYVKMQNPVQAEKFKRKFEKLEKQVAKITDDILNTQEKLWNY